MSLLIFRLCTATVLNFFVKKFFKKVLKFYLRNFIKVAPGKSTQMIHKYGRTAVQGSP